MTVRVLLLASATSAVDVLPPTVKARVLDVIDRLRSWPNVSGAKPMRGDLKGHYRIRTGDWRVSFALWNRTS